MKAYINTLSYGRCTCQITFPTFSMAISLGALLIVSNVGVDIYLE